MKLESILTCPECGFKKEEQMPENYCQILYQCTKCGVVLKPKKGDCCVYCSYGTEKCPPLQTD
jgi:rubredoxin